MYSLLSLGSAFYFFCFLLHLSACVALYFKRKTAVFPLKSAFFNRILGRIILPLAHSLFILYFLRVFVKRFSRLFKTFLKRFFPSFFSLFSSLSPSFSSLALFVFPFFGMKEKWRFFYSLLRKSSFSACFRPHSFPLLFPLYSTKTPKKINY